MPTKKPIEAIRKSSQKCALQLKCIRIFLGEESTDKLEGVNCYNSQYTNILNKICTS
jgi:hypothetical protein